MATQNQEPASFLDWIVPFSPRNPLFGETGLFSGRSEQQNRQAVGQRSFLDNIITWTAEGQMTPEEAVAASGGAISMDDAQGYSQRMTRTERYDEIAGQKRDAQLQDVEQSRKPLERVGDEIRRGYAKLWSQSQADIADYVKRWEGSVADLENLSGAAAENDLKALGGSVRNAKTQLMAQAEASGIPPDQAEIQGMFLDWQFAEARSKVVRDYQIAYNNKRADMNTAFGTTYGQVLSQIRSSMAGAFSAAAQLTEQNAEALAQVDLTRAQIEGAYYDTLLATRYSNDAIILGGSTGAA